MAQQVQLASKLLSIVYIVTMLAACSPTANAPVIPAIWLDTAGQDIVTRGGITYHHEHIFSGTLFNLYTNGDTAFTSTYLNGKQEGCHREWYVGNRHKEIRYFIAGRKEGEHKGWFENGRPKFIYHYHYDVYEGNVKEWFENGLLFKNFNYKNGQEDGMQQMFWDNGKLRANYQVLNGRQYGLTGVKNCVSVWGDSRGH